MASNYWSKGMAAWDYSSLPQCGSSKRLQLRRQDLKSNNMVASEDGRGAAVAEALGGKDFVGQRQEKIAAGMRRKHVGRWQEKITVGVWQKLALSSMHASILLVSKLRGGRLVQQ